MTVTQSLSGGVFLGVYQQLGGSLVRQEFLPPMSGAERRGQVTSDGVLNLVRQGATRFPVAHAGLEQNEPLAVVVFASPTRLKAYFLHG